MMHAAFLRLTPNPSPPHPPPTPADMHYRLIIISNNRIQKTSPYLDIKQFQLIKGKDLEFLIYCVRARARARRANLMIY